MIPPLPFRWNGEAMAPLPRFAKDCDKHFVVGEIYRLVEHEDRSIRSHQHFFASVNEAWKNLPDDLMEQFPTPDHLRKYALIKAGFADSRQLVAASKAEARRIASFVRPCDEYAVVAVHEAVVTIWTARSQSMKAMGARDFQASKDAVLNIAAGMIRVTPETLQANAGRAA